MINTDRIVSVTQVDLLSLYGLVLLQASANSAMVALQADTIDGEFTIDEAGIMLAAQPVKSVDITASSATLYFVADYEYEGFMVNGAAATIADNDVEVVPDGHTLYKAVLASGTVTITKVGF